ncbi:hypothetical protein V8E53_001485, partial [Lactarius tabidus]
MIQYLVFGTITCFPVMLESFSFVPFMIPYRFECNVLHVLLMLSLPSRDHHCPLSSNPIIVIPICDILIDL